MDCSTPGFPDLHHLLKITQTHVHCNSDAIQSFHHQLYPSLPAFNVSQHPGFFSSESVLCIRRLKYWSFSFSISSSKEYVELISFRIDWFDLLAVQGSSPTPQFKSINSSVLSLLYGPPLTSIHDYWKNYGFDWMDLCWQSNVAAFNMLSRFVITFLQRSKRVLISWLQSSSKWFYSQKNSLSLFSLFPHWFAMKWWDQRPWSRFFKCWVLS